MMLVPSLAVGIFTCVLRSNGYQVDLFDTTHYSDDEGASTQERVKFLQVRKFSEENDLGISARGDMLGDFRKKVLSFQPDLILFSVVEDVYCKSLNMLGCIKDLNIPLFLEGFSPLLHRMNVLNLL